MSKKAKSSNTKRPAAKTQEPEVDVTKEDDLDFDFSALVKSSVQKLNELQSQSEAVAKSLTGNVSAGSLTSTSSSSHEDPALFVTRRKGVVGLNEDSVKSVATSTSTFLSTKVIKSTLADPAAKAEAAADATSQLIGRAVAPALVKKPKKQPDTAGKKWFNMPAAEMTEEVKMDLRLRSLRPYLNQRDFVSREKGADRYPKYFQIGVEVGGAKDMNSGLSVKNKPSASYVEHVLNNESTRAYLKRKLHEVQDASKAVYKKKRGGKSSHKK